MLTMLFALCHRAAFYARLLRDDNDRADKLEGAPCPRCGRGVLHDRSYKRSPRGHPPEFEQCEGWNVRRSFTCTVCGKRVTPSSRRFLGRRVYFAPVVIAVAMEEVPDLTLAKLNEATLAWVEREYHRSIHSAIAATPLERFLEAESVAREAPSIDDLRVAFTRLETRTQRRSDGTVAIAGVRFEVPSRFGHVKRIHVRYARWDLSRAYVCDEKTGDVIAPVYPQDKARNAELARRQKETPAPRHCARSGGFTSRTPACGRC